MAEEVLASETDLDDEAAVLAEIEETIRTRQKALLDGESVFTALRSGAKLPVMLNGAALVVAAVALFVLWQLFVSTQESYVLRAADGGTDGQDIVAALLAESRAALDQKEETIEGIRVELSEVEARLAELEAQIAERLAVIRDELESSLTGDVARREQELRAEGFSGNALNAALDEYRQERAAAIDAQIATRRRELESEIAEERDSLIARRDELSAELESELRAQEQLAAQVEAQQGILDDQQESDSAAAADPLQELREQQQLIDLFNRRIRDGYQRFSDAVGLRDWELARTELDQLVRFVTEDQSIAGVNALRDDRSLHGALTGRLTELVIAIEEGWEEPEESDVLPGWESIREQIAQAEALAASGQTAEASIRYQQAMASIPGLNTGVGLITTEVQRRSVSALDEALDQTGVATNEDPEIILRSLTDELSERRTALPPAFTRLVERLDTAVSSVEVQREQLQDLTSMAAEQLARLQRSVGASPDDAAGQPQSVEEVASGMSGIASQIEALRGQIEQSRLRQEEILASLAATEAELAAEREQSAQASASAAQLARDRAALEALQTQLDQWRTDYEGRLTSVRRGVQSDEREVVLGAYNELLGSFEAPIADDVLPDMEAMIRSTVEVLVALERARAQAEAEDRLLAEMLSTTERIAEEQVRLLATASSANDDTMELLDSLISEIDQVATEARADRESIDFARVLGTITEARGDGTMVVRQVADLETFAVRRVYVSRQLPNGDRFPIADAEIIATAGDSVVIRITSTIAPTIRPSRNDLVYVEY